MKATHKVKNAVYGPYLKEGEKVSLVAKTEGGVWVQSVETWKYGNGRWFIALCHLSSIQNTLENK